jgi:hypothetical protein
MPAGAGSGRSPQEGDNGQHPAVVVAVRRQAELVEDRGLAGLAPAVRLVIPWPLITGITVACLVTALVASLIPAGLGLRRHPAELAPAPE